MPYIYKYTDRDTDTVKYVGIIRKESNFPSRFAQHKTDYWSNDAEWIIEYAKFDTICEVECLEGHLIAYYETYKYYNKAKSDWGNCSFAPHPKDIQWQRYFGKEKISYQSKRVDMLYRIRTLESELSRLRNDVHFADVEFEDWAKESLRNYISERLYEAFVPYESFAHYSFKISLEDLFEDYTKWAYENDECDFDCLEDFVILLSGRSAIHGMIRDDQLVGFVFSDTDICKRLKEEALEFQRQERNKIGSLIDYNK